MGITFIIDENTFDVGSIFPGFIDAMEAHAVNPTRLELIDQSASHTDFNGWSVPANRLIEIYTALAIIDALRPRNHPLYPDFEPDCTSPEGYWRLINSSDMDIEPGEIRDSRFTPTQYDIDNEIRSKVYYTVTRYLTRGCGISSPGDYNGDLSVYFWDAVREFKEFLDPVIKSGQLDTVRFDIG